MSKQRWATAAFVLALVPVFVWAGGEKGGDTLSALRRHTVLLNFVNGLHLTATQLDSLLAINCEAETLRARHEAETRSARRRLEQTVLALQPFLEKEMPIPDSLRRAVHRAKAVLDPEEAKFRVAMARLARRSVAVLTTNQLYLVRDFKACLIPPTVGAIGQDQSAVPKHLENALRRLRGVPDWRYGALRDRFVRTRLEREQKEGFLTDSVQVVERRRFLEGLLDEMRQMDEPTFLRKLPRLAEALRGQPVERRPTVAPEDRAARYLLDPEILPILQMKRALLAGTAQTTRVVEVR